MSDLTRLADIPEPERTVIADLDCPVYADTPPVTPVTKDLRHVAIVSTAVLSTNNIMQKVLHI